MARVVTFYRLSKVELIRAALNVIDTISGKSFKEVV